MRPVIVHGSAVPPVSRVLTRLPTEFEVPVELLDPSRSFDWRVYVDYDRVFGLAPPPAEEDTSMGDAKGGSVRTIRFRVSPDSLPLVVTCHSIEFVVAYKFLGTSRLPDAQGSDSLVWWFNPNGDLGGCPAVEGGAARGVP